jgi:ATP-dependent DNA helicase RecG
LALKLETGIQFLKGVGARRAALYAKLRVFTAHDLLYHFPRAYVDLSRPYSIAEAPVAEPCAVRALLVSKSAEQRIRAKLSIYKLRAEDETGTLEITMFNTGWTVSALKTGEEYIFYGKVEGGLAFRAMSSPEIYAVPNESGAGILPVYPQTAGLSSKLMRMNIRQCLEECELPGETLPQEALRREGLMPLGEAMRNIHFPETPEGARLARARFIFEELFELSLGLAMLGKERVKREVAPMRMFGPEEFYAALPFSPTAAQRRCIAEACADMCGPHPMNRLIQGDVGSGKTLVAAACCRLALLNGAQSAVMAPTEILAEQHYETLRGLLGPCGAKVALLKGSATAKEKRLIREGLLSGEISCCVGTHALLAEGVAFRRLGLVVTDEQHRFGVGQRARLSRENADAHVLVMSATPIPRTLALIIYGDLKLSVLDELPPGRKPVETLLIHSAKRGRALGFVRDALGQGRQAYLVCPLIEAGENAFKPENTLLPATEYEKALRENELKGCSIALLHGKMKPREKENVMRGFKRGEIQALVATTVIEVGVDVPNATIMMVENAERFGLSQLHQLRGRVGRGAEKSWCILVSDAKGGPTRERLNVMRETSNGFEVAERDLKLRGPGDFFGSRQHGLPALKLADLAHDLSATQAALGCAKALLEEDPGLEKPGHAPLKEAVARMMDSVGERPN